MLNEGSLKTMSAVRKKEEIVLNFHDSLLRESDVQLLEPEHWLNDNIIGFMLEYFEQNEFKDAGIAFIGPSVSQLIRLSDGSGGPCFLESLNLHKRELIFLVINDNESRTAAGGLHWSLLVYKRSENSFSHYDSFRGYNISAAKDMVKTIKPFLKVNNAAYKDEECPQQNNGSDCGVYVISIASHLCKQYLGLTSQTIMNAIDANAIVDMRKYIKELIIKLGTLS